MRYYSTQRPVTPGTYPAGADVTRIVNFDKKTFCEEIGREAWGYLEMAGILPENERKSYELTKAGTKIWHCTMTTFYDGGRRTAFITGAKEAEEKPAGMFKMMRNKDIYIDWYGSYEEALAAVENARRSHKC